LKGALFSFLRGNLPSIKRIGSAQAARGPKKRPAGPLSGMVYFLGEEADGLGVHSHNSSGGPPEKGGRIRSRNLGGGLRRRASSCALRLRKEAHELRRKT